MKKVILVLVFVLSVVTANAQKFGVTAGLNASNEVNSFSIKNVSYDWKIGFQAGAFMDFAIITPRLSVIPELLFTQRGTKINIKDFDTINETFYYVQLPVNFAYKFDLGNEQSLFPFAGAYIGHAMCGTAKSKQGNGNTNKRFGSSNQEYKRIDWGLNFGVGYQYTGNIVFKLQYNPGLQNFSRQSGYTTKNTNIAVTVGYFFKK